MEGLQPVERTTLTKNLTNTSTKTVMGYVVVAVEHNDKTQQVAEAEPVNIHEGGD